MTGSCPAARRRALESAAGTLGMPGRFLLARHMVRCSDCRSFSRDAGILHEIMPFDRPPDHVRSAVMAAATRELSDRSVAGEIPAPAFLLGLPGRLCVCAAAALLALVIIDPPIRTGAADPAPQIDAGIDEVRTRLDTHDLFSPQEFTRVLIEETMDDIEKRMNCLESEIDNMSWSSLEGGEPCTDS